MDIQTIFAPDGSELIVMTRAYYDRLLGRAPGKSGSADSLPISDVIPDAISGYLRYGFTPLEAWRTYRGMTPLQLQRLTGIPLAGIVRLETMEDDKAPVMRAETRQKLASVLNCPEWALESGIRNPDTGG